MDKAEQDFRNKIEKHIEHLRLVKYYSIQRIDLLIISISGAGVYTCFEIMKYIDNNPVLKTAHGFNVPFKWSGLCFIFAIIVNFVSQWTAYQGSSIALDSSKLELEEESEENKATIKKLDDASNGYRKFTVAANLTSNALMIIGLLILILSLWVLF